jgi:hypothetical protein
MQIVLQKNLDVAMFHCLPDAKESSGKSTGAICSVGVITRPPPR